MKVVIFGSRTFANSPIRDITKDEERAFLVLDKWHAAYTFTRVISGAAKGADAVGEKWARINFISLQRFPADWDSLGRSAGIRRNEEMAREADMGVCFWDGTSRGTSHMIRYLKSLNKTVLVEFF